MSSRPASRRSCRRRGAMAAAAAAAAGRAASPLLLLLLPAPAPLLLLVPLGFVLAHVPYLAKDGQVCNLEDEDEPVAVYGHERCDEHDERRLDRLVVPVVEEEGPAEYCAVYDLRVVHQPARGEAERVQHEGDCARGLRVHVVEDLGALQERVRHVVYHDDELANPDVAREPAYDNERYRDAVVEAHLEEVLLLGVDHEAHQAGSVPAQLQRVQGLELGTHGLDLALAPQAVQLPEPGLREEHGAVAVERDAVEGELAQRYDTLD
mmetsp:Transcript_14978/g.51404  ORF Transcript_14978/g.51404 Transcript_14978/m.51404 type:complete len:265 (+) Transcript_14978:1030-1824(+)